MSVGGIQSLREIVGLLSLPGVDRDGEGQTDKLAQSWSRSQIPAAAGAFLHKSELLGRVSYLL